MSEEEVITWYSILLFEKQRNWLGLMICFNIVEKYNGTLRFTSAIGEGTTVTVRLPLKSKQA